MDVEIPSTSQANENENHHHKGHKKKSKGSHKSSNKNGITYESQKELFSEEILEQIRIFRDARSTWLKSKEATEEARPSQIFFGEETPRKKTPWYKRTKKQKSKKSSLEEFAKVEEGLEEYQEGSLEGETVVKGILKKRQSDLDEESSKTQLDQEEVLGVEESKEDVGFRDDMEYDSDRVEHIRERRAIRIKDVTDLGESEYFREERPIRLKDDFRYEKEKKREREIKKSKEKLLQFKKIPGPEDQCKCEHSGEYTVLVKGVCFCEKPIRPTCIPIIPPAYLNPRIADPEEPDVEIEKVDSLELTRRSLHRSSSLKERKVKSEKSPKWGKKNKDGKKEAKLVEIYSRPDENVQEAKRDKVEIKSAKSVQDMKFDFSPHHRAHLKTDHHAPLHFEDLSAEEEDGKSDTESQPETRTPPEKLPPFLLKRKATQVSSEHSKHPAKQPPREPIAAAKPILEKDKKPKTEHGHVHFSPENQYADEDWDTSKYYTKYGQAADTYKRKNPDKTVMTVLIETFTDWWKGKSKD